MQKYKSLSLTGKGQTAAVRRCPRFFRDRKRQSDHFAAAGYPTRRPEAAHGNERCGGFAPPSPALCAPPKGRGRNSSRVIIVFGIIPCPRRFVNRAALFFDGGASHMRRAARFILRPPRRVRRPPPRNILFGGSFDPRQVRRAAPSRHTRRPFAAAARACRARRSFPLPAR